MSAEEFLELCAARNLKIVLLQLDDPASPEAIEAIVRAAREIDEMTDA